MSKTQNTKILRTQIAIGKDKIFQEKILSKRASLSLAQKHEIYLKKSTEPSIKNKKLWFEINSQAPETKGKRQVKMIFLEIEEALTLWILKALENGVDISDQQREAASALLKKLDEFKEELQDLIHEYSLDDVFNCDETELYWKIEPKRTISNKPVSERKQSKDQIIILLCSNATGTEKLKPAFIHKYKNPVP
ncbi:tigger transposable element-derived protein 6-like [Rhizophagus clarus]|uniref:Tigger transposable element-derived protein 6-like n=1 Tax=Rhizophagus clarus TaxID=94130 RepID=A0A8H3R0E2_9GLOM|nr:tigger transposable element-derived protein 6-like [Rhizophagus clarus]